MSLGVSERMLCNVKFSSYQGKYHTVISGIRNANGMEFIIHCILDNAVFLHCCERIIRKCDCCIVSEN